MRKIKAQPLTAEAFSKFGSFTNLLEPTGYAVGGGFYNDRVLFPTSGRLPVGFSSLVAKKADKMIVSSAEYHNYTGEAMLPLDDDCVMHFAPASNEPVPELTEAFIVPKGTMVKINTGVWHLGPMPINADVAHILIALPQRVYFNDCYPVNYDEKDQIEIEL